MMAVRGACARALGLIFHRSVPLTVLSAHPPVQHGRLLVSISHHYFSPIQPPKKPPGAFLKFMNSRSSEITRINPEAGIGERAKIASQLWHALNPEERNRMKLEANEDLKNYREKYLIFLDGLSDQEKDQFVREKKTKRTTRANRRHKMELKKFGKPKMPPNAFMLFVRSSRLERGNAHPTQFVKGLVEYWRQMPQAEKDIYLDDARVEREKYQQDMTEWEDRMKEIGREDLIRKKSLKRLRKVTSTKAKKTRAPAKKKKTVSKSKAKKKKSTPAKSTKKKTVSRGVQTEE